MVPDHIDDLPHRDDDNRQPMFGLIDELPQEGSRDTRQLMAWGLGLAVVVVLFVVLVWVTAPSSREPLRIAVDSRAAQPGFLLSAVLMPAMRRGGSR